jgi:VanZ family protein
MIRYAAALLWTALIFVFSSDTFSAPHTGSILQSIATAIFGHPLSELQYEMTQFVVRKLAHLTAYAILATLWFRALRGEARGWAMRWSVIAVLIAIAVAATDEFHQSFVPSRTGTPFDVVIDVCGAILAQVIIRRLPARRDASRV